MCIRTMPIEMFEVIKFSRQDFFVGSNAMMKITIVRETAHPTENEQQTANFDFFVVYILNTIFFFI